MTNAAAEAASKLRVVLSNSYGTLNVGDEAILTAMVDYLDDAGCEVDVLTYTPDATRQRQPKARPIRSGVFRGSLDTCQAIRRADLLLVGGGGILQDATSLGNLLLHVSRPLVANATRTPVIICDVGVGPLRRPISRRLTAAVCRRAADVFVRDEQSAELLASIGVPPEKVTVAADLALLLAPLEREEIDTRSAETLDQLAELKRTHGSLIGLSLRPPIGTKAAQAIQSTTFRERLTMLADVADNLAAKHDSRLVFVSMHPDQDRPVGQELRSRMQHPERMTILPGWLPPKVTRAAIGSLDLLIGMRLHSLIFAAMASVPMIALGYDEKVAGFLKLLGLPNQVLPESRWQREPLLELADHSISSSKIIRATISQNLPTLQARAAQCMQSVVQLGRELAEH